MLFIEYPRCSTCRRAKKWLDDHGVSYTDRHIVTDRPTAAELREWKEKSGLPLRGFFNTSGQIYRAQNLKERLGSMSEDEQYELLASDGMLVKRPLLILDDLVLTGFKEDKWEEALLRMSQAFIPSEGRECLPAGEERAAHERNTERLNSAELL